MSDDWFCSGCGERIGSKEEAESRGACPKCGGFGISDKGPSQILPKKTREWELLLDKDKKKNPHIFLISQHLWWLALVAKIALVMIVLQFFFILLLFADNS